MGDEKHACGWLSVNPATGTETRLTCILIDDEYVSLPLSFNAEIIDCCSDGKNHLSLAVDDRSAQDFAGRLEIAAAMGKEVKLLHALIGDDELGRVKALIEAQEPVWQEQESKIDCWSVYPHSCKCENKSNKRTTGLFNIIKNNGHNGERS